MDIMELLKVYKDLGSTALFLVLLMIAVFYFYKELKSNKTEALKMSEAHNQELRALSEKVISIADKSATAIFESNRICSDLKQSSDQIRTQNNEFVSFLKGRDEGHNKRISR